jgi:uncharacterized membrane protein SpoIIM required for sporulation
MNAATFLETRAPAWDRLQALVSKGARNGVRGLTPEELHELARLYPDVAVDAARARMLKIDSMTQQRINQLAIAAHGLLYRRPPVRVGPAVWRFLSRDYPRLFRRMWAYLACATALFLVAGLGAYASVQLRPSTVYLLVPGSIDMPDSKPGLSPEDISQRFRRMPHPPMAAGIMANNVSVAFGAFALGISGGIGTCILVFYNAVMLGALASHFANHGLSYAFWSFILPHGVLEITAILIAAGAGLRLGLSLVMPGALTRGASLRAGAREAVLLVLGTIPMFIVAGTIEGFVTPSYLPGAAKIILGVAAGAAAVGYALTAGRIPEGASAAA